MTLLRTRPIVITLLLILVNGSGSVFVTAFSVIFIAAVITFICFTFKMQIDSEFISTSIGRYYEFFKQRRPFGGLDFVFITAGNENSSNTHSKIAHTKDITSLRDLPRPIARKLKLYINGIMQDFIKSWYEEVGPGETQFVEEAQRALEIISVECYKRICNMDSRSVAVNLINLLTKHLKIFNDCCNAVHSKYPGIRMDDFEKCIIELYETRVVSHITSKNQGTELDFLRTLTDMILYALVPENVFSCEGGRFMLREILAINGLYKLIDLISDPHFVNRALIDIFEEATPLAKIIEQWREEEKLDLFDQDDKSISKDKEDLIEFDSYESATDDKKRISEKSRMKGHSDSSIDHLHEISDNIESNFGTPKQSTTDLSSTEESYDAFDRVLRQNQLEARLPAPVYGSTMVKLYEQTDDKSSGQRDLPIHSKEMFFINNKVDSRKLVTDDKRKYFSAPDLPAKAVNTKDFDLTSSNYHRKLHANKEIKFHNSLLDMSVTDVEDQKKLEHSYSKEKIVSGSSWDHCPPASSGYYRKSSYNKMDKRQDLLHEKLKARLHAFGSNIVTPVSCFHSHEDKYIPEEYNLPHSMEESIEVDPSSIQNTNSRCHPQDIENVVISENVDFKMLKVHSVPDRNIFYEPAPNCPTCIEMTTLANPFEAGKAVATSQFSLSYEHECGLSSPHLFHAETYIESIAVEEDAESFVSCESDNLTDLDISLDTRDSESTLLASTESTSENGKQIIMQKGQIKDYNLDSKTSSMDCFEIMSLINSDTEFSSFTDFDDRCLDHTSSEEVKRRNNVEAVSAKPARAPSVTTFASAHGSSTHENETQQFATPYHVDKLSIKSTVLPSFSKSLKAPSIKSKKSFKRNLSFKIVKSFRDLRYHARGLVENVDVSSEEEFSNIATIKHVEVQFPSLKYERRRNRHVKAENVFSRGVISSAFKTSEINDTKTEDSFSGATDTDNDITFENLPRSMQEHSNYIDKDLADGCVDEIATDYVESEVFEDAKSEFQLSSSLSSLASSFLENDNVKGNTVSTRTKSLQTNDVIPIYRGEVIMPHPSEIPVSAWMYPVQMISIPGTEVAFEKGWEPGGNKYTLYNIHYDIRIWPEIYKKQLLEASQRNSMNTQEALPLIREIKRRYREFMFLHNRLTHGQMSEHMKGVLRPNRRYAMPFGRMDPDVIAGRRKILESYLVSLVSRQDVCNSKEFKEFLGAEGFSNASFIKPKLIQPKQVAHKFDGNIKSALTGTKDAGERSENSRYFIHGYEVPRMFGYAEIDAHSRHSSLWFSNFIVDQMNKRNLSEEPSHAQDDNLNAMSNVEFFQRPKLFSLEGHETILKMSLSGDFCSTNEMRANENTLCEDTSLDGGLDRRFSIGIPALFSNEFAARKRTETLSTLDARKAAEKIPWPLADAVMSFICEALKDYDCWLTYENVQQALLYSLGGLLEWQISLLIRDVVIPERWMKYLDDLYHVIWEKGELKRHPPQPSQEEKQFIKEEAVEQFLNFLPAVVRIVIGSNDYGKWAKDLLHAVQYEKINRHVLYAVVELILGEFIPELKTGFSQYKSVTEIARNVDIEEKS